MILDIPPFFGGWKNTFEPPNWPTDASWCTNRAFVSALPGGRSCLNQTKDTKMRQNPNMKPAVWGFKSSRNVNLRPVLVDQWPPVFGGSKRFYHCLVYTLSLCVFLFDISVLHIYLHIIYIYRNIYYKLIVISFTSYISIVFPTNIR